MTTREPDRTTRTRRAGGSRPTAPGCAFVPPYLLRQLAQATADRRLLVSGTNTLEADERMRERRAALGPHAPLVAAEAAPAGNRTIYDTGQSETLPGTVARRVGDPETADAAVDEAFVSSGQVWDLFAEEFGRSSVDDRGTPLTVTVHYGRDYDNAFWDGSHLVFGDGDGEVFDRFTKPMDVMAHEFTHGVTQFTAGLTYQGQSGALNESVSDVFASMAKQRLLGQSATDADWLIGEGLFRPGVQAKALRSMLEPGTAYDDPRLGRDPQVGSMADYVDTTDDNGGVHLNSGIPNRAFALAARGIGGSSWEKAGKVWYDALTSGEVTADTDFAGFARATVSSAQRLFATDGSVADQVRGAWQQVGLLGDAAAPPAAAGAPVSPAPLPVDAQSVAVRRSGGMAGRVRSAELALDADPFGTEVRRLLDQISVQSIEPTPPAPDRFVYTVACGSWQLTLPEQDLTPELHRVVEIVLDQGDLT